MIKVAIFHNNALSFNYDTIEKTTLGGSESASILLSKELVKLDLEVTIYNDCKIEGVFNGVRYLHIDHLIDEPYDILIAHRSFVPFFPDFQYGAWKNIVQKARWKAVWLHDYLPAGFDKLEYLLLNGFVDEVFTLSDAHFLDMVNNTKSEVVKRKFFHTRNGVFTYYTDIDIEKKNPEHFIYNATMMKGLIPLLETVWPEVRKEIPDARLTIIGGISYQNMGFLKSQYDKLYQEYQGKMGILFTGMITQKEVAEYYRDASYYLYPSTYPETFGISVVEGFNYNVVLISCNNGALEEIATVNNAYMIDGAFDKDEGQLPKILEQVKAAYYNQDALKQKMVFNNNFKDILGWDTVALQWKIHFERILGIQHNVQEITQHQDNIKKIIKFSNKRFINPEDI
jgi:glycosyltransferase involved in cell wall biosynthesis